MKVVSIKEKRQISSEEVRKLIFSQDYYKLGDNESFRKLINYCCSIDECTIDCLQHIASDILEHSLTCKMITDIMYELANNCCYSVFSAVYADEEEQ